MSDTRRRWVTPTRVFVVLVGVDLFIVLPWLLLGEWDKAYDEARVPLALTTGFILGAWDRW